MQPSFLSRSKSTDDPIGVFDSGIGGLTVAKALKTVLPNESLVYFGDTAHLPYGEKSKASLQAYVIKSIDFLLEQNAKLILIACNSASAAAFELAQAYVGSRVRVVNVIDPIVEYISQKFDNQDIGLIGTRQTVHSRVYEHKLAARNPTVKLHALATPLLAGMIEEGFFNNSISQQIVAEYLQNFASKPIKGLVLACTHYPLIKKEIEAFLGVGVEVIDASGIVAEAVRKALVSESICRNATKPAQDFFFVSDFTESFAATTRIFFGEAVQLALYKLWE
ncbi:MAG: glutamate racemase [Cytophagales bacterium]|nr:MAG: glutamate racemase [Cytophagales bacterium]TAF60942.1 MAG: glutamate racemase [Cytophagales bacterium]